MGEALRGGLAQWHDASAGLGATLGWRGLGCLALSALLRVQARLEALPAGSATSGAAPEGSGSPVEAVALTPPPAAGFLEV